jgi:PAS domain S-box-containing protein
MSTRLEHQLAQAQRLLADFQKQNNGRAIAPDDTVTLRQLAAALDELQTQLATTGEPRPEVYRQMFEKNRAVKLIIDPETGEIVDANPAACDYYGYDRATLKTLTIADINILSREQVHAEMDRARTEQRTYFVFRHRLASGELRDVEVHSSPIEIDGRPLLFSIIHDITARIEAERQFNESALALEQRVTERTAELAASNAHLRAEIAERERVEEALRTSEAKWRQLVQHIPALVIEIDLDGTILTLNRPQSGLTLDDYIGQSIFEVSLPQAREKLHAAFPEVLHHDHVLEYETSSFGPRRTTAWYHCHLAPITTADRAKSLIMVLNDITAQKEAEARLRESEARYQTISELVTDFTFVMRVKPDGIMAYEWINDAFLQMSGFGLDEVYQPNVWGRLFHPDDAITLLQDVDVLIADPSRPLDFEYRLIDRHSHIRWVRGRAVAQQDPSAPGVFRIIGAAQDFTQRREAERALRASEEKYRSLFEHATDSIFIVDPATRQFLDVNARAAERLGYTREELIGQPLSTINVDVSDQQTDDTIQALRAGRSIVLETIHKRKDGTVMPVEISTRGVEYGNTQVIQSFVRDITDRKLAEAITHEQRILTQALSEIAAALSRTLDLDRVLELMLIHMGRVVPHDAAHIVMLANGEIAAVRLEGYAAYAVDPIDQDAFPALATITPLRTMIETRQPVVIGDTTTHTDWTRLIPAHGLRAYAGVPIFYDEEQRIAGFLCLESATPEFFTAEHIERLQAFASHAAIALRNATQYEQSRQLAALEERQRLARDLHDAVSQMLFSASLIAGTLPRLLDAGEDRLRAGLEELQTLTQGALAEMRTLLLELRPATLLKTDFDELLRQLTRAFTGKTRVPVDLTADVQCRLPENMQITLYRIAQEALNNISKHARATQVVIRLECHPERVRLSIQDNGRGFDPQAVPAEKLGVQIMHERAASIGAEFALTSAPDAGTQINVAWDRPIT